jgi:hypothetical protein
MNARFVRGRIALSRPLAVVLVAIALFAPGSLAKADDLSSSADRWWKLEIAGQSVGYLRENTSKQKDGDLETKQEMMMVIGRLGSKVVVKATRDLIESPSGELRTIDSEISSSLQSTNVHAKITAKAVEIDSTVGGKQYHRSIPTEEKLLGPEGARRLGVEKLRNVGDRFEYTTFIPELDSVTSMTRTLIAREEMEVNGSKVPCLKIEETRSNYPGKRTEWVDRDGRLLRQSERGGLGLTETIRTDRITALSAAAGKELSDKLFDQTLARSNIRFPSPRSLQRVVLHLHLLDSSSGWPQLASESQRIIKQDKSDLTLEVRTIKSTESERRPVAPTVELREYLEPNAIIQSDDSEVQRLAHEIVQSETDSLLAARRLEHWVNENMKFDTGIALASASECVRNRRGTCIAFSVLLSSLCRAAGIPARVVIGYAYVSGIWGGHAWTEVRIGKQWIALDAAIYSPAGVDAARFGTIHSSLAKGIGLEQGALLQLMNNVSVQTLEYDLNGKTVSVPENAAPYQFKGDTYRNVWLGFELSKPGDYRFTELNEVYPKTVVLSVAGPGKQVVRLHQIGGVTDDEFTAEVAAVFKKLGVEGQTMPSQLGDHPAVTAGSESKMGAACRIGSDLWVLTAESDHAVELLKEFSTCIKWLEQ